MCSLTHRFDKARIGGSLRNVVSLLYISIGDGQLTESERHDAAIIAQRVGLQNGATVLQIEQRVAPELYDTTVLVFQVESSEEVQRVRAAVLKEMHSSCYAGPADPYDLYLDRIKEQKLQKEKKAGI